MSVLSVELVVPSRAQLANLVRDSFEAYGEYLDTQKELTENEYALYVDEQKALREFIKELGAGEVPYRGKPKGTHFMKKVREDIVLNQIYTLAMRSSEDVDEQLLKLNIRRRKIDECIEIWSDARRERVKRNKSN